MFRALLICGDGDCAETFKAYGSLDELEALAYDCACALEVLEISELGRNPLPIGVALKEALERPSGGEDVGGVLDEHVEELLLARNERESHVSRCGGPAERGRPPR